MVLVLAVIAVLGVLTGGGVALWAILGGDDDAADAPEDSAAVPAPMPPATPAPPPPDQVDPIEPPPDPVDPLPEPTDPPPEPVDPPPEPVDPPPDPSDPPDNGFPGPLGPRVSPTPWISFTPPDGGHGAWDFQEFPSDLPAFDGIQEPDGYLEVFVDDSYPSLQQALEEIEIEADTFGAEQIGREELDIPGADRAVELLYSVPDEPTGYDQGILLLETGRGTLTLLVVMFMISEGDGPTIFQISETFASVELDADSLLMTVEGW